MSLCKALNTVGEFFDPLVCLFHRACHGVGCGVLTFLFRYFGSYVEGVSYAILIMNCCVGFFDRIGVPKRFGAVRQKKQKKGGAEA